MRCVYLYKVNQPTPDNPVPKSLHYAVPGGVGVNRRLSISSGWEQGMRAMDVVDGRRPPFPPHRYSNSGDTRDTDTQAPSSGDSSPSSRPYSSDHLHSPDGSPCSAEEIDKDSVCSSPLAKFATSPSLTTFLMAGPGPSGIVPCHLRAHRRADKVRSQTQTAWIFAARAWGR
ncbi:glucocorticoid-induced transcript 1 protein-like protein [Lates japonicus]|uniref:Glucocorticoid-induced transcript 1 protein-like protein n=1 Tax=Lates japonicus TaxID=270547 RepID=A0AAD3MM92_LATJO|nr:glucocorticoid-induced transcript 1 protein-like protein [Lates japonicus]